MHTKKWSHDWPKRPGTYWFYGWCFGSEIAEREPELCLVQVRLGGDKQRFYVTNGHFLYKGEGARGMWLLAELPPVPQATLRLSIFNEKKGA